MSKSFSSRAIVLKRLDTGESDRIVTLLSELEGKIVAVAKGVRKLKSSNRANLEPGNIVEAYFIKTRSLPLLTQTKLIKEASQTYQDLPQAKMLGKIRQISQILEIFDRLFVENFIDEASFSHALKIHRLVLTKKGQSDLVREKLDQLVQSLGYQKLEDTAHQNILDYVAEISEKKMRSYDYLKLK